MLEFPAAFPQDIALPFLQLAPALPLDELPDDRSNQCPPTPSLRQPRGQPIKEAQGFIVNGDCQRFHTIII